MNQPRKKRILLVNEASYLNTGYSNYGLEVMRRLYETGKYELAELAGYVDQKDPRNQQIPWRIYANLPSNEAERSRYQQQTEHEFGAFKFEQSCIDFRPDIVFSVRDTWMDVHIVKSYFRKFYYYSYMPTVDSLPQQTGWIDQFMQANAVFAYNDWSFDLLKKQGGSKINLVKTAAPGASVELPILKDKANHKKQFGLPSDSFIIGTVMRNQKRKLYPALIDAFKLLLAKLSPEQAKKTFLYFHVSYPDLGWNIPKLVKESGISSKILFTYVCRACNKWFVARYQDAKTVCIHCQNPIGILPNTQVGLDRNNMHAMVSLFDAYVQYACAEAQGMPQIDAAIAGVPVFSVDYSGMSDVVSKLKGFPIKVLKLQEEAETGCLRAIPDDEDFADKMKKFISLPESMRKTRGIQTRKLCEKHYNWDKTAKVWEEHFDSIEVLDHSRTWLSPIRFHQPNLQQPNNLNNERFVAWALTDIAGRPDLVNTYTALQFIRDLNWGATTEQHGGNNSSDSSILANRRLREFSRQDLVNICLNMAATRNHWEQVREQCNQTV